MLLALTRKQTLFLITVVACQKKKKKGYWIFMLEWDTQKLIFKQQPEKTQQSQQCNADFKPLRKGIFLSQWSVAGQNIQAGNRREKKGKAARRFLAFFILPSN